MSQSNITDIDVMLDDRRCKIRVGSHVMYHWPQEVNKRIGDMQITLTRKIVKFGVVKHIYCKNGGGFAFLGPPLIVIMENGDSLTGDTENGIDGLYKMPKDKRNG